MIRPILMAVLLVVLPCKLAAEKPRVAIRTPTVSDKVSKWSLKHLDEDKLTSEMEASLFATRKFELLTRQPVKLEAVREEQQFSASDFSSGKAAVEGGLEAANYLIIPTVTDFKFYRASKPVPNISGKYFRSDHGFLELSTQLIDSTSGGIKATFYQKASFSTGSSVTNSPHGAPATGYFATMAKEIAAQMTDQLVSTVFPMKVMKVSGDQLWINRGADGGLKEGTRLTVFRPDDLLIDPDTGESLGAAEIEIGTAVITRINPKVTIATVEKKPASGMISVGDILRLP